MKDVEAHEEMTFSEEHTKHELDKIIDIDNPKAILKADGIMIESENEPNMKYVVNFSGNMEITMERLPGMRCYSIIKEDAIYGFDFMN
jgi:hypothetical protein